MLRWLIPLLIFWATVSLEAGRSIRINGPGFAFMITEPEEWVIDFRSAAQIAHFVITPGGMSWRTADLAIFGRFVEKTQAESLETFLAADEKRFLEECPLPEIEPIQFDFQGADAFLSRSYQCLGSQNELVAVTDYGTHFGVFILSSRSSDFPPAAKRLFGGVLESLKWMPEKERKPRSEVHPPPQQEH